MRAVPIFAILAVFCFISFAVLAHVFTNSTPANSPEISEKLAGINKQLAQLNQLQEQLNEKQEEFNKKQEEFNHKQGTLTDNIDNINTNIDNNFKSNNNKNVNNKESHAGSKEDAITLIEKQLELKRIAHEAQAKTTRQFRKDCVDMNDARLNTLNAWVSQASVLWWMYENTYQCSVDLRMGRNGDGGKWVCNPDVIASKPCVLYSFGVKDDFSFETEVSQKLGCIGRLYDPTINVDPVQRELNHLKDVKIAKLGAGHTDNDPTYLRLSTMMKQNGHDYIDIFKIDIEGAERAYFKDFFETHNKQMKEKYPHDDPVDHPVATMILVELHYGDSKEWPKTKSGANFDNLNTWLDFFQLCEDQGYAIYHKEMNLYDGKAAEYAFVHVKTMERLEKEYMVSLLEK